MNNVTHTLKIKGKYFNFIDNGSKDIEVQVGYSMIKKIKVGDFIQFMERGNAKFQVTQIKIFKSFAELFKNIPVKRVFPDITDKEKAICTMESIYPKDREALGVYAIFIKKYIPTIKLMRASTLIHEDKRCTFSTLISECYRKTDFIVPDYPYHFEWYFTKTIPAIFNGSRDIFAAIYEGKVVGVLIAKKEKNEKKICTLWVDKNMRNKHIATLLLESSFKFLGTTKPLISIADYKLDLFLGIITKYGWIETQKLPGYYNNSTEIVFNGTLE